VTDKLTAYLTQGMSATSRSRIIYLRSFLSKNYIDQDIQNYNFVVPYGWETDSRRRYV